MANELKKFSMIENYIYIYHIDKFIILPAYPESIIDNSPISFSSETPMSRTAPIFSYNNAGPRTLSFQFDFTRDIMEQLNYNNLETFKGLLLNDDYVDTMMNCIRTLAYPRFDVNSKMVDPPMCAVKIGEDVFIKGIVNGAVSISYGLPILRNGKYSKISLGFSVTEVEPYDADRVMLAGGYRGLDTSLERKISMIGGGIQ